MIFKYGYILFVAIVCTSLILIFSLINHFNLFVKFQVLHQIFDLLFLDWGIQVIVLRQRLESSLNQRLVGLVD